MAGVTIASYTVPNWEGGSDVVLRIYALSSFFASDGTDLVAGCPSDDEANGSNFYGKIVCTVADAVLTIPETVLESTTDSEDNPGARYGAWFYTSEGERLGPFGQFQRFALPPTPTSTSWPAIEAAQAGS